mmetsp:Transcript_272/g.651  ORF Transcript_272/g.651 Transcript_272/m.651 type:complete len:367 (-) Transcript_272:81-1181(-)
MHARSPAQASASRGADANDEGGGGVRPKREHAPAVEGAPASSKLRAPRKKCAMCGAFNPTAQQACQACGHRFTIKAKVKQQMQRQQKEQQQQMLQLPIGSLSSALAAGGLQLPAALSALGVGRPGGVGHTASPSLPPLGGDPATAANAPLDLQAILNASSVLTSSGAPLSVPAPQAASTAVGSAFGLASSAPISSEHGATASAPGGLPALPPAVPGAGDSAPSHPWNVSSTMDGRLTDPVEASLEALGEETLPSSAEPTTALHSHTDMGGALPSGPGNLPSTLASPAAVPHGCASGVPGADAGGGPSTTSAPTVPRMHSHALALGGPARPGGAGDASGAAATAVNHVGGDVGTNSLPPGGAGGPES